MRSEENVLAKTIEYFCVYFYLKSTVKVTVKALYSRYIIMFRTYAANTETVNMEYGS